MTDIRNCQTIQLIPEALRNDTVLLAESYALQQTAKMLLEKIDRTSVYARLDILPEYILDLLAVELRVQYYDQNLSVERKREIVKTGMLWYFHAGTLSAVNELIEFVWGKQYEVQEWQQYGGEPYTFRIYINDLENLLTEKGLGDFISALYRVKNVRSHIEKIVFRRRQKQKLHVGAGAAGYTRQSVIDFYTDRHMEDMSVSVAANTGGYTRQSIGEG